MYARLAGDRIAYQVLGEGPPDLVVAPSSFGHIDINWEDPGIALFLRSLASFSPGDPVQPAGHGPLGPTPARPAAAVGVVCRGAGGGPGRGRRPAGRAP